MRGVWAVGLAAAGVLAGCSSGSKESYTEQYNEGHYATAYAQASRSAGLSVSEGDPEARLTAGLAAHAMGKNDEAERWLRPLTSSPDRSVAGPALAALGLIDAERGRNASAAGLLSRAAQKLSGDESARASLHAGDAYAAIGRPDAARMQYRLGATAATDSGLRGLLQERLGDGSYTVQVGAFTSRMNAEKAMADAARIAGMHGLQSPRLFERMDDRGQRLYLVQMGLYPSEAAARRAQQQAGLSGIIALAPGAGD